MKTQIAQTNASSDSKDDNVIHWFNGIITIPVIYPIVMPMPVMRKPVMRKPVMRKPVMRKPVMRIHIRAKSNDESK
jgi:hypothetical protein